MSGYKVFKDAYAREETYGTTAIGAAGATTYKWGVLGRQSLVLPSPATTLKYRPTGVGDQEVPAGEMWKDVYDCLGMLTAGAQNGILIQAVMGGSSTAGADPYTHTLTKPSAVGGVLPLLPSFTMQHERTGTATDWAIQFTGVKFAGLHLFHSFQSRHLLYRADIIARKAVDPGFLLSGNPALPPTANEKGYMFNNLTRTFDGNPITGLQELDLFLDPGLEPEKAHTWDGATYTGRWIRAISEAERKEYTLTLKYMPGSDDLWDELVATGNTKNIVLKWTRGANDYIQATLTDCHVFEHGITTPQIGTTLVDAVKLAIRSVSVEVKDSIAKEHYGE